jgi:hypothetical protein
MPDDSEGGKTLGAVIDGIIALLKPLDEETRRIVVNAVCEHLRIVLPASAQRTPSVLSSEGPQVAEAVPRSGPPVTDIRSFAQEKAPSAAIERAVLVAYYLTELAPQSERRDSIDKEDLKRYFKQAGFPLPKRPEQTLVDARHAGYLDPVGEGKYRLNPVGYNLIAHTLPRRGEQGAASRRRVGRKRQQAAPRRQSAR